ncbi:FAD:protein FMN transferase [Sorangium sp. So ce448]|uniref:FAD:protein FMN transferase n=1 Tax=Sorangium sp. So ce448 TaxID=3133314 RepID=UPI003F641B77
MHGPRCSSLLFCFCSCLAAALALAACDARPRARQEAGPAASSASAGPLPAQAAPAQAGPARVAVEARAMGTNLLLAAYTSEAMDEAAIRARLDKAIAEIRRLEGLMTTWRPDSELSRVNAAAGKGAVEVSSESLAVIEKSLWISERSEGVFDVTFEAMHGLWKFDEDIDDNVPRKEDVERARALIDHRQIKIDRARRTVMLGKPGMRMSLGGIAKGYAVDAAARVLRGEGLTSFFVQAGGDLYIAGKKPDGSPWRAGVRDPRGKDANDYFAMIEVEDHAFSTAGDYERSFIKDGRRYHHIIDPRTGFPASESRSVTIWAKDALTADAVDDAAFILGAEKGLALVESIEDCGAVIVDRNNKVWVSKRLEGKVEVLRQPTEGL